MKRIKRFKEYTSLIINAEDFEALEMYVENAICYIEDLYFDGKISDKKMEEMFSIIRENNKISKNYLNELKFMEV
jgi:hypothetical protein